MGGRGMGGGGRGMGGGGRGMGGGSGGTPAREVRDEGSFGIALSVYSLQTRQWVAAAKLTDAGNDTEEGMRKLADEVGRLLPGVACAGWSWPAATSPTSPTSPAPQTPPTSPPSPSSPTPAPSTSALPASATKE